ncbi:siderophore-interacting protein [Chenggangzhangella methanolivorans]|uniref:Siderophore-interacting protein n=1 Tax=Chenggangzhangella methanolivorans TaxID=1437009 RepID=A0A9E6ULI8_9HYPH|nr:siderophore-interacting protein [Chenggangzhangella methanolivorans]QZO00602.1 siderophore-interacting protein [Chenggangzhangella methanolivorans]
MTRLFVSEAEIRTENAEALAAEITAYWDGYEVELETQGSRTTAKLGASLGVMEAHGEVLRFRLECAELGVLEIMRSSVTETFLALGKDEGLSLAWRGEMPTGRLFADFREVRLVANVEVAPRIRRLTFTGDDVARFGSAADIHVRIYFPPDGLATPEWPRPGPDGRTIWPEEAKRPEVRYYTVRRWRPEANEIDVDFVMHEDEGPGCAFASRATPGAIVGMAGPVGRVAPKDGWTLYAGDETALPAIARMLEEAPREAAGVVFIEVNSRADEIALDAPAGVAVRWLHRRGAPAGATDLLHRAVIAAPLPMDSDPFVWAACEVSAAKAIRKHLKAKGLARDRFLVVGYWQREAMDAAAA